MVQLADGQIGDAPGNDGNGGADAQAYQLMVPVATPSSLSSSARQAQLAQLKVLQARLDEQRRQTQELRTALEQQRTVRGAQARVAGRVARVCAPCAVRCCSSAVRSSCVCRRCSSSLA